MTKVEILHGKKLYIEPKFLQALDIALDDVKKSSMDLVIVVDGSEGIGKSFLARGLASYCAKRLNSSFSPEDIYFDIDTYIDNSIKHGQPTNKNFKINVLDEGRNVVSRRRATSKDNVRFTNYMSECRAMQQVHIICIPAYHDLDSYIVLWRMAFLIHLNKRYIEDSEATSGFSLQKGDYSVFIERNSLNACYDNKYIYPKFYSCRGQWPSVDAFDDNEQKAYADKKYLATMQKYGTEKGMEAVEAAKNENGYVQKWKKIVGNVILKGQEMGLKQQQVADLLGIAVKTVRRYRDELNIPKIYNKYGTFDHDTSNLSKAQQKYIAKRKNVVSDNNFLED